MNIGGYINGQWTDAQDGDTFDVVNPATGAVLHRAPRMGAAEAQRAVEAAAAAMAATTDLDTRRAWLKGIADGLHAGREPLARIITSEQGKPIREARIEVDYAATFFTHAADHLDLLQPRTLAKTVNGCTWTTHHRPTGVAALITPWNFPLAMIAKKLASALGAGCATVCKPAELTPLSAMRLAAVCEQAGVQPGWFNLVFGKPAEIGRVFCAHPAVRIISFTGSTAVGKLLAEQAAPYVKRLALELGGSAPFLVFEDADLPRAAKALIESKFRAAGQTCVCANRVLVRDTAHHAFIDQLKPRIEALRSGDGMSEDVDLGPLINRAGWEKVDHHVRDALVRGATRLVGADLGPPVSDHAAFYPPTLLTGVTPDMAVFREETFGPVVALSTFKNEDEAVRIANSTPYGLAAYVMSGDTARVRRIAARLHFGHVAANSGTGPAAHAPFGGMKHSGFGREGGEEGLMEFTETQVLAMP